LPEQRVSPVYHGGNLAQAEAEFGKPEGGWLDLSTGINPTPYPIDDIPLKDWHRLPDTGDMARLDKAARHYFKAPKKVKIVAAPGTQSLLQWLPTLVGETTVTIVEPTYGEHRACWSRAGHEVISVNSLDDAVSAGRIAILVNPNNPDGRHYDKVALRKAAKAMKRKEGLLIIDGAFEDVREEQASSYLAGEDNVIVLRSFGKFFGLAGLRLGFALCPRSIAQPLQEAIGPWSVSQPAIAAGCAAMEDETWIAENVKHLAQITNDLHSLLTRFPLSIIGGTTLFQLIEVKDGNDLYRHLANVGILTRPFPDHPSWLRFGLPANLQESKRLCEALESYPGWR